MAIGTNTLATATFDAKLVISVTTTMIMKITTNNGKTFKTSIASPSLSFNPEDFAAVDNANPPPGSNSSKIC